MRKIANKLNGYGGGHMIASGATIPSDKEDEFIKFVDDVISKQMGL